MATGTGKTVVMAMLIAWQTLNKVASAHDKRYAKRFLVVAPGITIRERLRVLRPEDAESYYRLRDLVPADLWPGLGQARIAITNFHGFLTRERGMGKGASSLTKAVLSRGGRSPFLETPDQVAARVLADLGGGSSEVVVFNDEAHHCYRGRAAPEEGAATRAEPHRRRARRRQGAQRRGQGLVHRPVGRPPQGLHQDRVRPVGHTVLPVRFGLPRGHAVSLGGQRLLAHRRDRVRAGQDPAGAGRRRPGGLARHVPEPLARGARPPAP